MEGFLSVLSPVLSLFSRVLFYLFSLLSSSPVCDILKKQHVNGYLQINGLSRVSLSVLGKTSLRSTTQLSVNIGGIIECSKNSLLSLVYCLCLLLIFHL